VDLGEDDDRLDDRLGNGRDDGHDDGSGALVQAAEAAELAASLQRQLSAAREREAASRVEADQAASQLRQEVADVDRLESRGWARALATLKGSRDDDLRREQAEAADARLRLEQVLRRHDHDVEAAASLEERLRGLGDVDAAYAEAQQAREEWLRHHDVVRGPALADLAEEEGRLAAEEVELSEAHEAGREAHALLLQAFETLGTAGTWATWDTFGGGGMFTDAMKYDRLRTVGRQLERAADALRRLDHELADTHLPALGDQVRLDGWEQAFDVWFDNFFSDWAVRRRIEDARAGVGHLLQRVQQVGHELARARDQVRADLADVVEERRELVT